MDKGREQLYSPASTHAVRGLSPASICTSLKIGAAVDVKDAYLKVKQKIKTTISVELQGTIGYRLLMCVPGQRDGSAN